MLRLVSLLLLAALPHAVAQSIYSIRPEDPLAVAAGAPQFPLVGDGRADDTPSLQAAIDRVADTTGQGVVFLPQGRYRITQTLHLWSGIRLIGYGAQRPVIVLGPNTPGFQSGHGFLGTGRYMLQFASNKPRQGEEIVDANEFTFFSAISNVDFEIGPGNPAAIAIRFHVAQHSFLDHMHISVGEGRAALEDVGNQAENLDIDGGEYGIISVRTSPAWQFLLMDSRLHGQRVAAIHTQEVGMTLVRDQISDTPVAVETPANMPEQLYTRDLLLKNIGRTAFVLGDTTSQHNQVTLDNLRASNVKQLLTDPVGGLHLSGPVTGPFANFFEQHLTAGQEIGSDGRESELTLRHREQKLASLPTVVRTDIPSLPAASEWTSVRTLGALGDGGTDDTAALQQAINTHHVLYFPTGIYRVRGTLNLKPDTILIGLNPSTTVLYVEDNDPNFMGAGDAVPVLESTRGGHEIVSGIGVYTGDIAPRAAGIVWRSGAQSFLQDVNFGAGLRVRPSIAPKMKRSAIPFNQRPDTRATEYPSLWFRDGGGGILRDIWTADTVARAGLLVEHTETPAVVYQISCEHHMHNEVQFHDSGNWTVYALQTEEEKPNGAEATAVELIDARNITFANLFDYRVSRNTMPKLAAVTAQNSTGIRFANMHNFSMTRLAFDNSILDSTSGVGVRTHDFTVFSLNAKTHAAPAPAVPSVFAQDGALNKLVGGFHDVAGLVTDTTGRLYFADATLPAVATWDGTSSSVKTLTSTVPEPVSLGLPGSGDFLLALDRGKAVYSVNRQTGATEKLADGGEKAGMSLMLPVGFKNDIASIQRMVAHQGLLYAPHSNMALVGAIDHEPRQYFYAPGTTTALIAGGSWKGFQQAIQLQPLRVGQLALAISEEDDKLYRVTLDSLTHLAATPFVRRSGTSVAQDAKGNIYIAGAQVFVYDRNGIQLGILEVPERPSSLAIGGRDGRILYIGARSSLYSIGLSGK